MEYNQNSIVKPKTWILLIEDDKDLLGLLNEQLTKRGYGCVSATKASDAVTKIDKQKFSLILLDLNLETGSGTTVLSNIRRNEKQVNFETPVIVISGFIDQDKLLRMRQDIQDVLVKPFSFADLIQKMERLGVMIQPSSK